MRLGAVAWGPRRAVRHRPRRLHRGPAGKRRPREAEGLRRADRGRDRRATEPSRSPNARIRCTSSCTHLVLQRGLLLHGSNNASLEVLEARPAHDLGTVLEAVVTSDDAIWPMFYAVIERERSKALLHGLRARRPAAAPAPLLLLRRRRRPGRPGLLDRRCRLRHAQGRLSPRVGARSGCSPGPVRPSLRVPVRPDDFPLRASVPRGTLGCSSTRSSRACARPSARRAAVDAVREDGYPRCRTYVRSRSRPRGASMLTGRQQEIWTFLTQYVDEHGYPPTVREIGEAVGLASPVHGARASGQPRAGRADQARPDQAARARAAPRAEGRARQGGGRPPAAACRRDRGRRPAARRGERRGPPRRPRAARARRRGVPPSRQGRLDGERRHPRRRPRRRAPSSRARRTATSSSRSPATTRRPTRRPSSASSGRTAASGCSRRTTRSSRSTPTTSRSSAR